MLEERYGRSLRPQNHTMTGVARFPRHLHGDDDDGEEKQSGTETSEAVTGAPARKSLPTSFAPSISLLPSLPLPPFSLYLPLPLPLWVPDFTRSSSSLLWPHYRFAFSAISARAGGFIVIL